MPDLADELRKVADEAAREARPLPVAAVMNLGDRRRRRRWSRSILATAAGAGIAATVAIVASTGALGHPGPRPAAMLGGCTERVTLAATDGRITGCVTYQSGHRGLRVRSVEASFTAEAGFALPNFTFTFRNQATGAVDYQFSTPLVEGNAIQSHNTGRILLSSRPEMRSVHRGAVLEITLKYENPQSGRIETVATLSLSLNPRGLLCPNLGQEFSGPSNIPTC